MTAAQPWSWRRASLRASVVLLSAAAALLMMLGVQRLQERAGRRLGAGAPPPPLHVAWSLPAEAHDEYEGARHELLAAALPHHVPESLRSGIHEIEELAERTGRSMPWLLASNRLSVLRAEFRQRFALTERRRTLHRTGAHAARDDRIQQLAEVVAERIERMLARTDEGEIVAAELAYGLRALLVAGSSRVVGPHRDTVRRVGDHLAARLAAGMSDGDTAAVLAGLTDLAVVSGGRTSQLVREHATRLAQSTVTFVDARRPALLHRQTPVAALADAGYVLRLAPAFGTPGVEAERARRWILGHMLERRNGQVERPELLAAMLYGFGDLIDRDAVDRELRLWRPHRRLLPDFRAVHHLVWGQLPLRSGWAQLQDDLRLLTAHATPDALGDSAALLMALAMNFAAPGALELELLAHR